MFHPAEPLDDIVKALLKKEAKEIALPQTGEDLATAPLHGHARARLVLFGGDAAAGRGGRVLPRVHVEKPLREAGLLGAHPLHAVPGGPLAAVALEASGVESVHPLAEELDIA